MRVAELCAGYGGLHMAMRQAGWDVDLAWYAEKDRDASNVMAHHHPSSPNLGDITTVDWGKVEPVDIMAAGWPCQPFSLAGKRKGYEDDRAIWEAVACAVRVLRPRLFLGENVPGHLARGQLGRVVAELAGIGYVGSWLCVRASDLGAPHQRKRVFLAAYPADADRDTVWPQPVPVGARHGAPVAGDDREGAGLVGLLPTPGARLGDGRGEGRPLSETVMRLLLTPRASDGMGGPGHAVTAEGTPNLRTSVTLLPTPRASDGEKGGPNQRGSSGDLALPAAVQPERMLHGDDEPTLFDVADRHDSRWGQYTAALERWERVIGRCAPEPTEPGRRGKPRLAPRFVEWMMGLPDGHVTSLIHAGGGRPPPGEIDRNAALKVLGNGVVPLQGAAALLGLAGVDR